jgi:hypothetical protein
MLRTTLRPLNDWRLWLLAAIAGLLVAAAMAAIAPAKADACTSRISTKAGDGSIACISNGGFGAVLDWCDRDNDGHRVFARFSDTSTGWYGWTSTVQVLGDPRGYDPNGAASGCGHLGRLNGSWHAWTVCVQYEGCARWVPYDPTVPGPPTRVTRGL